MENESKTGDLNFSQNPIKSLISVSDEFNRDTNLSVL